MPLRTIARPARLLIFSKGATAIDLNFVVHTFEAINNSYSVSITTAVDERWALNYRHTSYNPVYMEADYNAINRELNVVRKINDNVQFYAGYSETDGSGQQKKLRKGVIQAGVIGTKKLSDRTTFFVNLGGRLECCQR